jgi:hypothetical protein
LLQEQNNNNINNTNNAVNKYNVYIPYLNSVFVYKANIHNSNNSIGVVVPMPLFGKEKFIIKVFIEENTFKQKIRLQLL